MLGHVHGKGLWALHLRVHDQQGLPIVQMGPNCWPGRGEILLSTVRRIWISGMEVAPEASTAIKMAFTSWGMSMGKDYELHLRIQGQQGL